MMLTEPGNRPDILQNYGGERSLSDPAGMARPSDGGRLLLQLPPQTQSWMLQNPALPSQLEAYLKSYRGSLDAIHPGVLEGLVRAARAPMPAETHGNAGLPDEGAGFPDMHDALGGAGSGPKRFGGSNDLSEPQPTYLGTVRPPGRSWGESYGT